MAKGKATTAAPKKRGRPPGRKTARSSKGGAMTKKRGRPRKSQATHAGRVLISKKMLKDIHKGIASLEAALGSFANALRVLE